jgi:very-short-patch-repair endonuclease
LNPADHPHSAQSDSEFSEVPHDLHESLFEEYADLGSFTPGAELSEDLCQATFEATKSILESNHSTFSKEELLSNLGVLAANHSAKIRSESKFNPAYFISLEKFENDLSIADCRMVLNLAHLFQFKSEMTERILDKLIDSISVENVDLSRNVFRELVHNNSLDQAQQKRLVEHFIPVVYEMPKFDLLKTISNTQIGKLGSIELLRALASRTSALVSEMSDSNLAYALNNLKFRAKYFDILNHDYIADESHQHQPGHQQNVKRDFLLLRWQQEKLLLEVEKRLEGISSKSQVLGSPAWKNCLLSAKNLMELGQHQPSLVKKVCHRFAESHANFTGLEAVLLFSLIGQKSDARASDMDRIIDSLDRVAAGSNFSTLLALSAQLVRLNLSSRKLFEGIANLPDERLAALSQSEAISLLRVQAKSNQVNGSLLKKIDEIVSAKDPGITNLGMSLACYARLRFVPDNLLTYLSRSMDDIMLDPNLKNFQIASIFRSLTVLDAEAAKKFWDIYKATLVPCDGVEKPRLLDDITKLNSINLCSIYHSLVVLDLDVPPEMLEQVQKLKQHDDFGVPTTNTFERAVGARLRSFHISARPQVWFEGLYLDFLIENRDLKIALECDGRSYHMVDGKQNGSTWLHTQFLEKRGFIVIRLDSDDWRRADESGKHKILKDALNCYLY